jgi:hypothetical protein
MCLPVALSLGCQTATDGPVASDGPLTVEVGAAEQVVPGPGLPDEVSPQNSNNNLDIARDGERLFLAARTAPDHFASPAARLYVISSTDQKSWQFETQVQLGSDLREPRLLAFGGKVRLFFAQLGDNPSSFDPKGAFVATRLGPGQWTAPQPFYAPSFIPWRFDVSDGVAYLVGYTGGDGVYQIDKPGIAVHLLRSSDGEQWQPVVPGQPVVMEGGVSEVGLARLDDGSFVAVGRNERGEPGTGFGSKVCRGGQQLPWTCRADKRKFDSPLLLRVGKRLVLIARRSLDAQGQTADFDLGESTKPFSDQYLKYQGAYWVTRKRCALWQVDAQSLEVTWLADLPSRGDTCFASAVPADAATPGATARRWLVYNYSSPLQGDADPPWFQGQLGPTHLYRQEVQFAW